MQSEYSKLLEYWRTEDYRFSNKKFLQDKKTLENVVFSEINNKHIENPIIELVVKNLKHAIYYEAQQYFQFYPEGSKDTQKIVQELEKRTKMKAPSDRLTIE
ncbi:hypothetical protein, partial [Lactococcus petauri]|uniref:hypothetical protein n=1 Tax=Lactococcus petauri TaxID=1940789 RepID=UPI00255117E5